MSAINGTCRTCRGRRSHRCRDCDGTGREPLLQLHPDLQAWREHGQRLVLLLPAPTAEDEQLVEELLLRMRADEGEPIPIPLPPDDDPPEAP